MSADPRHSAFRRAIEEELRGLRIVFDYSCDAGPILDCVAAAIRALPFPEEAEPQESTEGTLRSIAAMLGWMNVPPRRTLEMEIAELKRRALSPAQDEEK